MNLTANAPGFIEAQNRLRADLGSPVTFKLPVTKEWPEAEAWDEAGKYLKGDFASEGGKRYKALEDNEGAKPSESEAWEVVGPQTKINPDTGLPYDATIQPTSAEFTEVVKTVHIVLKHASPLRPQSDTEIVALGEMSGMDIIIDLAAGDYADVEDAVELVANGLTYHVREAKPFSIAGTLYRWLIYGEEG